MQNPDDYLMLSGIQHFYFCKRQWCLIHIEQVWLDNVATKEGDILHQKADDPFVKEKRQDLIISRAIPVSSSTLKLSGILDVVEFRRSNKGVCIDGYKELYQPFIVEYKRGKKKKDLRDIVQLTAQAMCLEEAFSCEIKESYLYYHKTNTRERIQITDELRDMVKMLASEMHELYRKRQTVSATAYKNCKLCSLKDLCMPRITKKKRHVNNYVTNMLGGLDEEIT